ncbi:MAG: hypothetical protein NTZ84_01200 [Candidatus Nealsonbacteria bacterium]|nr:hypothetical protein [Candidatus Nealsonbacteria bacterium]
METIKQIATYTGGLILAVIAFHIFVITFMVLTIMVSPEQVAHTAYWDGLLKAMIGLLN